MDNCCFNRPFDNQSSKTISFETQSKLFIQEQIRAGYIELVWSFVLTFENSENPFDERREAILLWKDIASQNIEPKEEIRKMAIAYHKNCNLKPKDSLHLACAVISESEYLLTTDRQFINNSVSLKEIKVINPLDFFKSLGGEMKSDTMIRSEGLKALREKLGLVEAERFVNLIKSDQFDYTEWQKELWKDRSVDDIFDSAKLHSDKSRS
jgi:predicted nucleic acid-binding protein